MYKYLLYNSFLSSRNCTLLCILITFFSFSFIFPVCHCSADDDTFSPWDFSNRYQSCDSVHIPDKSSKVSDTKTSLIDVIHISYRSVSAVDGDRCQMSPTCSEYSIQAFKKHGFFLGFIMTFDRLIHENDELSLSTRIGTGSSRRVYDPVSNNDFWWHKCGALDK
jgi:hypothetical protein